MSSSTYLLAGQASELERLQLQSRVWQPSGRRLLAEWLSPAQRAQFEQHRYFDVVGSDTGRTYRIHYGTAANVQLTTYFNGTLIHDCQTSVGTLSAGAAGTYIYGPNTIAAFDDVKISTP